MQRSPRRAARSPSSATGVCAWASSSPIAWTRAPSSTTRWSASCAAAACSAASCAAAGSAAGVALAGRRRSASPAMARPTTRPRATSRAVSMIRVFTRFASGAMGGEPARAVSRQEQIENTLTAGSPALKSRAMAVRDILILPDKRLRLVSKPVAKIDAATRAARRGHVRDHVRGARHRARRDPDRRAQARRHHGPRQEGRAEGAAGVHQSGAGLEVRTTRTSTRKAACRSRNTTRRSSGRRRSRSAISISTASSTRSRPTACWRPASSTRSTISTACCSSTTSPS